MIKNLIPRPLFDFNNASSNNLVKEFRFLLISFQLCFFISILSVFFKLICYDNIFFKLLRGYFSRPPFSGRSLQPVAEPFREMLHNRFEIRDVSPCLN